jgi:hypothetical protein
MLKIVAIALLLFPQLALGAGFAKQSLFLSRTPVTEGETVFLHAVVNNDATTTFSGEMTFAEGTTTIGKVPVTLDPGEADATSISWKPAAGSHAIVAELKKGSTVVERQTATFKIEPKPVPKTVASSTQAAATVESSEGIQKSIERVSPAVAGALAPVFRLVDGGREALANVVEKQLETTKQNLGSAAGNPGSVLSAETAKNTTSDPMGTLLLIVRTLYFYLLTLLGFIIASAGIFYPVAALIFFYILWRIIRRVRRPA